MGLSIHETMATNFPFQMLYDSISDTKNDFDNKNNEANTPDGDQSMDDESGEILETKEQSNVGSDVQEQTRQHALAGHVVSSSTSRGSSLISTRLFFRKVLIQSRSTL